jgi:hypothetical protein
MKMLLLGALVVGTISGAAQAKSDAAGEISYPKGSIGYEALMRGDNERAVSQIMANAQVSKHDAGYFKAAMQTRDSVDLVLADGRVMNSKVAAREAYANLQTRIATR